MDMTDTIAKLTAERDRIDRAIEALQAIDSSAAPAAQPSNGHSSYGGPPVNHQDQVTASHLAAGQPGSVANGRTAARDVPGESREIP